MANQIQRYRRQPMVAYKQQMVRAAGVGAAAQLAYKYGPYVAKATGKYLYKYATTKKQNTKNEVRKIKANIVKLKKYDDSTTGTMTYRICTCTALKSGVNVQAINTQDLNSFSEIETVLGQCKFYDPTTPGTLIVSNPTTGTYQRNILIENTSIKIKYRNNYQVPCTLVVYACQLRQDTSLNPETCWSNGVIDGSNLTSTTSLNQFPTDYNLVTDLWRLTRKTKIKLEPGQEHTVTVSTKSYEYDAAVTDSHTLNYQKRNKSMAVLSIVKGNIAHDTSVPTQQGLTAAGVDMEIKKVYKVKYSAGINISYSYVSNTYDTFTNGAVVSNKPTADNQAYSVS